jgi:hypothetical protein
MGHGLLHGFATLSLSGVGSLVLCQTPPTWRTRPGITLQVALLGANTPTCIALRSSEAHKPPLHNKEVLAEE